jgi:hypothetical protein
MSEVHNKSTSRLVEAGLRRRVTINEKLDDALDKSFPASDPVSLGHSDHVGQPEAARKRGDGLPKGLMELEGKR